MHLTTFEEFQQLAQRGTFVPVYKEIVADMLTPVSAFLKIAEHSDYAFLLESVEGGEQIARYSFLGKDPFLILRSRAGATLVDRASYADAAVLAEMRFGAGRGESGTVVMLTFGTGIGTALFTGGHLFPNSELGHMELNGMEAEKWASAHVKTVQGLDWEGWIERVNVYLDRMHAMFWPDLFMLGGAISERFADFAPLLRSEARIRPAQVAGQAGVIGAASAAAEAGA